MFVSLAIKGSESLEQVNRSDNMMIVRCNVELNSWNTFLKLEIEDNSSTLVAKLTVRHGLEHIKLML